MLKIRMAYMEGSGPVLTSLWEQSMGEVSYRFHCWRAGQDFIAAERVISD